MLGKAERGEQRIECCVRRQRRGKPHVLLDRAPRQQPRLLENDAEPAMRGPFDATFEVAIEADDDAQERGLAAAGRPDQRHDFAVAQADGKLAEHVQRAARGAAIEFLLDVDIKPRHFTRSLGASGRHVVQAAAPGTFRWRA